MFCSDYPRGLVNWLWLWWFPAFDALPVAPALPVPFLLARRGLPVSLLGFMSRPSPCRLPASLATVALARLPGVKPLVAPFWQKRPLSRPPCPTFSPASRLIFTRACKTLGRAHGRLRLPEAP